MKVSVGATFNQALGLLGFDIICKHSMLEQSIAWNVPKDCGLELETWDIRCNAAKRVLFFGG